jgi:N-methylhydantoinase B
MATVMAIIEAMLSAFSHIDPRLAVASSCNAHVYTMSGVDEDSGRVWTFIDPQFGGMGARSGLDGADVVGPLIFAGAGALHCIEAYELEYPVRFERFGFWQDSGGPGRWRGGVGVRRDIRVLTDAVFTGRATDRCRIPPPGAFGGRSGMGGGWILNPGTDGESVLPEKVTSLPLHAGDVVTMLTSAGGGLGPAFERNPEAVREDVVEGRVSITGAEVDYGVVIDPATATVQVEATLAARSVGGAGTPSR